MRLWPQLQKWNRATTKLLSPKPSLCNRTGDNGENRGFWLNEASFSAGFRFRKEGKAQSPFSLFSPVFTAWFQLSGIQSDSLV